MLSSPKLDTPPPSPTNFPHHRAWAKHRRNGRMRSLSLWRQDKVFTLRVLLFLTQGKAAAAAVLASTAGPRCEGREHTADPPSPHRNTVAHRFTAHVLTPHQRAFSLHYWPYYVVRGRQEGSGVRKVITGYLGDTQGILRDCSEAPVHVGLTPPHEERAAAESGESGPDSNTDPVPQGCRTPVL
ncbi:hypothetical protein AAFF_G00083490 [Aldrovandia affinis]|uniref:Uncharacterized protein n=1 Tax=Aldrovandia affinis TaxID=143900 RepID=A0AAD7WDK5_9TELE|nr:hypothetical protein AAFF_G00083490 [Aldrovandia affinis]